jgi:hypothetical protein
VESGGSCDCGRVLERKRKGKGKEKGSPLIILDRSPGADWPVDRPRNWTTVVNKAIGDKEMERLRTSVNRGRPLGEEDWVQRTSQRLGLTSSLRNAGRPRIIADQSENQ